MDEQQQSIISEPAFIDDWLQRLVRDTNDNTFQSRVFTELTLTVDGFLISGTMVSRDEYYDDILRLLAGDRYDEVKRLQKQDLSEAGEESTRDKNVRHFSGPQYIHLRDARILQPGGNTIPPWNEKGAPWRIRLTAVSGFTFGLLRASE